MEPEPEPEPEPMSPPSRSDESMVAKTKRKAGFLRGAMGRTDQVTPLLFLGGKASATDWDALQQHHITHVINSTVNMPNTFAERGIIYLRVAVPDTESTDLARHFAKAIAFIDAARAVEGRVLVHCSAGMSRSVTLVLAYLMTAPAPDAAADQLAEGRPKTLIDAFRLVKSKRTVVAPNPSFMQQLCEYERQQSGVGGGNKGAEGGHEAHGSFDIERYRANRFDKCDAYVRGEYSKSLLE